MTQPRPGTRLAVSLREDWSRGFYFGFVAFWTAVLLTPIVWFLLDKKDKTFGGIEVVMAVLGVFALVHLLRTAVLWILVGDTVVEITRRPPAVGTHLDYFILQARKPAGVRSFEAILELQRVYRRSSFVELSVPLPASTVEPDGRLKIEGSMAMPEKPPVDRYRGHRREYWQIRVRIAFKGGFVHEEERPFENEKPPEGASSGG